MARRLTPISKESEAWLLENYASMKNPDICKHLGCTMFQLVECRNKFKLRKSEEFRREQIKNSLKKANDVHRITENNKRSKPIPNSDIGRARGMKKIKELSKDADWVRERTEKAMATRKETFAKERRRALFGLPQQTNMRVLSTPNLKLKARSRLREYGYICERMSNVAYYTDETKRSIPREENAKKWGIKVLPIESNTNQ